MKLLPDGKIKRIKFEAFRDGYNMGAKDADNDNKQEIKEIIRGFDVVYKNAGDLGELESELREHIETLKKEYLE